MFKSRAGTRCMLFFFQAEDGIRDYKVTGVQTCALPISDRLTDDLGPGPLGPHEVVVDGAGADLIAGEDPLFQLRVEPSGLVHGSFPRVMRSEEHTSELQSPCNLVCRLLLEKKKDDYTSFHFCKSFCSPTSSISLPRSSPLKSLFVAHMLDSYRLLSNITYRMLQHTHQAPVL